jgi:hypothetical protein
MGSFIDLTGHRYQRLTVLEFAGRAPRTDFALWKCRCDCGTIIVARGNGLRTGNTKSCGCLQKEKASKHWKAMGKKWGPVFGPSAGKKNGAINGKLSAKVCTTHGLHDHTLYQTWYHMIARCKNPNFCDYRDYGAKGVTVWETWEDIRSFVSGIQALLGPRPVGYTIDRINPHEGYYEWNVRWANPQTQTDNQKAKKLNFYSQWGEH